MQDSERLQLAVAIGEYDTILNSLLALRRMDMEVEGRVVARVQAERYLLCRRWFGSTISVSQIEDIVAEARAYCTEQARVYCKEQATWVDRVSELLRSE